jgi:hypothetical protein
MTHEEETENFIPAPRECEFCGEPILQGISVCASCAGDFCSKDCLLDHLKHGAAPRCGGEPQEPEGEICSICRRAIPSGEQHEHACE